MNKEIVLTHQMDQSKSCTKEDKWRADMIIRINETDTTSDTHVYTEILKPPKALVNVKPESYRPQILTIGPLHEMLSGSPVLYDCKALCVSKFMRGHGISDVEELMQRLFYDPSDLHIHYSGLPKYSSESLQLLVTVDTIFIREFLLFMPTEWDSILEEHTQFCKICNNNITFNQAVRDLFLVGNQIPMPFLKKLIEAFPEKPKIEGDELQQELLYAVATTDPFFVIQSFTPEFVESFQIPDFRLCTHLLDCLYVWVCREPLQKNGSEAMSLCSIPQLCNLFWRKQEPRKATIFRDRLPTASRLSKAGIRFRVIVGSISVIKYDKTNLRFDLPRLIVNDRTEDVLRNLVAHEQTSKSSGDFTKYVAIMDSLIDTPEDVAILTKAQVIENHLGNDERLVEMWNDMCINVSTRPCQRWKALTLDVMEHYRNPWRPIYVEFRAKYFSKPWLWISVITAFLLLSVSILQTSYTILAYYQAP